jgi:hypothetical protein
MDPDWKVIKQMAVWTNICADGAYETESKTKIVAQNDPAE